jgi:hypothetical protein
MAMTLEKMRSEASKLSRLEKAQLAQALFGSLRDDPDYRPNEDQRLRNEEAERRLQGLIEEISSPRTWG